MMLRGLIDAIVIVATSVGFVVCLAWATYRAWQERASVGYVGAEGRIALRYLIGGLLAYLLFLYAWRSGYF